MLTCQSWTWFVRNSLLYIPVSTHSLRHNYCVSGNTCFKICVHLLKHSMSRRSRLIGFRVTRANLSWSQKGLVNKSILAMPTTSTTLAYAPPPFRHVYSLPFANQTILYALSNCATWLGRSRLKLFSNSSFLLTSKSEDSGSSSVLLILAR